MCTEMSIIVAKTFINFDLSANWQVIELIAQH